MEKNDNQFNFEISPEVARGEYSNLALITHSRSEVIIDFAKMLPALPKVQVCSRIIMTPDHAKRLMGALVDNIKKYEAQYGPISLDANSSPKGTLNLSDLMGGNGSRS